MRSETPELASDVRDLMQIHQREYDGVEHSKHLGYRREADATVILPQCHITAKVGDDFPRPNARESPAQDAQGHSAFA